MARRLARSEKTFYEVMSTPRRAQQTKGKYQTPLNRRVVPTEQSLLREVNGDALSNGNIGQEHELGHRLSFSDTKVQIMHTSSTRSLASLRSFRIQSVGR